MPTSLDEIAKLMGYTELRKAQFLLLEHFKEKLDYSLLRNIPKQNKTGKVGRGGHNKKNYVLTSTCAKQLCMLSTTKKAKRKIDRSPNMVRQRSSHVLPPSRLREIGVDKGVLQGFARVCRVNSV